MRLLIFDFLFDLLLLSYLIPLFTSYYKALKQQNAEFTGIAKMLAFLLFMSCFLLKNP